MTDRELDAWIAEHVMGWRNCEPNQNSRKWEFTDGDDEPYVKGIGLCPPSQDRRRFSRRQLPYYTTDLNACAQAQRKLAEKGLMREYDASLWMIYWEPIESDVRFIGQYGVFLATARQRCEAMYAIRKQIEEAGAIA